MTTFEIAMVAVALLGQLGAFIAAFIKLKTDIAKVQSGLEAMRNTRNECIVQIASKADREYLNQVQRELSSKLDNINAQINLIVEKLIK